MLQIKGSSSGGLVIPKVNIVNRSQAGWEDSNIWQWRSSAYDRMPWIAGGWFKPDPYLATYLDMGVEVIDSSGAAGYGVYRWYNYIGGSGTNRMAIESYRNGGQRQDSVDLPVASDPDQWFFLMVEAVDYETLNWSINGKNIGTLTYDNQDGPWITAQNRYSNAYNYTVFGRRYAGSWQRTQTWSGSVYNFFIMDKAAFNSNATFWDMGMDANDRDTYYKPFAQKNDEFIVPITDEDFPTRGTVIENSDRGMYATVKQDTNDLLLYSDNSTYNSQAFGKGSDSDYSTQPVYGYTL